VKAGGRDIVEQGFAVVDAQLPHLRELAGDFCIADAALFYVEFWASHCAISLPPNCQAHYERMRARPVLAGVLREEGYR
jgi:glutathione S-transferase